MNSNKYEDMKINVRIKLSALWAAVMFLYIYVDYFAIYITGFIEEIIDGNIAGIPIDDAFLVFAMVSMTIPSLMIFLSLILKPKVNRWINIIVAIFNIAFTSVSAISEPTIIIYVILATIVEVVLLSLIVWYAWKWPTQEGNV